VEYNNKIILQRNIHGRGIEGVDQGAVTPSSIDCMHRQHSVESMTAKISRTGKAAGCGISRHGKSGG